MVFLSTNQEKCSLPPLLVNKEVPSCASQAYVELNEFRDSFWQETARWLGYEENLNPTTGQWGPSHVSCLTFKSLLQLRRTMSTGDLEKERARSMQEQSAGACLTRCLVRAAPLPCRCHHLRPERRQSVRGG